MRLLRQSTTVTIQMGPAVDKTDGVTEETALSPTVEISKAGAAFAARNSATAISHDQNGWYRVELNTTDTGTLGPFVAKFDSAADHLPVWHEFLIVPAMIYDSIVAGTDVLQADVTQLLGTAWLTPGTAGTPDVNMRLISGDATAADNAESFFDGTGYAGTNNVIPTVTTLTNDPSGVTTLLSRVGTPSNLGSGATVAANLVDIENETDDIGVAGAGLTAIGDTRLAFLDLSVKSVADIIESQRGGHTWSGGIFYVDGLGGNDTTGNGSRSLPWATITKALTACTNNKHDLIILLPNTTGNPNIITEASGVTVNKRYTFIRGPGRDVRVTRTGAGDVFSITVNGIELSGMQIATAGASSNGVTVSSADFAKFSRLWIDTPTQDGIRINVGTNARVENCTILAAGRDGVRVDSGAGSGSYTQVINNVIRDCVGSAVNLQGSDASDCRIQGNTIRDNAVGLTIASGTADTVFTDNRLINNATTVSDSGTGTLNAWNFLATDSSGNVTVGAIANNAITAAAVAADAVTELQAGLATSAALATVDSNVDAILIDTGTDIPASIDAIPTATENADELLKRDWASVSGEAARSVLNALRFLRNKWSISGATLTVTKENDSTTAWTGTLTTDGAADPVIGNDPS